MARHSALAKRTLTLRTLLGGEGISPHEGAYARRRQARSPRASVVHSRDLLPVSSRSAITTAGTATRRRRDIHHVALNLEHGLTAVVGPAVAHALEGEARTFTGIRRLRVETRRRPATSTARSAGASTKNAGRSATTKREQAPASPWRRTNAVGALPRRGGVGRRRRPSRRRSWSRTCTSGKAGTSGMLGSPMAGQLAPVSIQARTPSRRRQHRSGSRPRHRHAGIGVHAPDLGGDGRVVPKIGVWLGRLRGAAPSAAADSAGGFVRRPRECRRSRARRGLTRRRLGSCARPAAGAVELAAGGRLRRQGGCGALRALLRHGSGAGADRWLRLPDMAAFRATDLAPFRREDRRRLVARLASRADNECCHRKTKTGRNRRILRAGPMSLPNSIDTGQRVQHKEPKSRPMIRGLRKTGDSL